jgi:L-fuconolactonase
MEIIDTHQHFWRYDQERDRWIGEHMAAIRRDFLPADLEVELRRHRVRGCVAVQASQSEAETQFLLDLAKRHDFILGVVGWVDLRSERVEARLAHFSRHDKFRGVRHVVQGEADVNFVLRPEFRRGIAALAQHGLAYDILVYPHQLGAVLELVEQFPDQAFVIDHLAKPYIKDGFIRGWETLMRAIAQCGNVYCKISGLVTETDWTGWRYEDFTPYLDVVFSAFGPERVMYGSDWPVCMLGGTYGEVLNIVRRYASGTPLDEQRKLFAENAARFYGLR